MAVGYVKRFNLLKNAAWQLLIMSGICVLWDLGTGWRGWSVNIGIPDICLLIQIVMLIISRIRSLSPREYMIYYVMASVYSMILPFVLLMTGVIRYRTPSVICIGCSFLLMIGLIMFKRKEFKEEMHKKFHVGWHWYQELCYNSYIKSLCQRVYKFHNTIPEKLACSSI